MPQKHPLLSLLVTGGLLVCAGMAGAAPTLVVRASGSIAADVGPIMEVRVNGSTIGKVEVRDATPTDYRFTATGLQAGARVDVVFTNDAVISGRDRNLFITYLHDGTSTVLPNAPGVVIDRGTGAKAFDGVDTIAGQGSLYNNGALRLTWPSPLRPITAAQKSAARLLQQATFGPTAADIAHVASVGASAWLTEQIALPYTPSFVPAVQRRFDLGNDYRPGGTKYTAAWVPQQFWASAATGPDQLRRRVAFALHQTLMASLADTSLWDHARAYAQYLDALHRQAFGNYRDLLEDVALSPAMGIYLSHLRNRKEDPSTGRLPDENFARELMQLFSIGLLELNADGSAKLDASGKPVETYTNADVMAMARVFTGWSWGFPDSQLTEKVFRQGGPSYKVSTDQLIDLQRMKPYPGQHSSAEKRLFADKPWAVTIPANTSAPDSLRMALDAVFGHPNVGPFIGRQLIQHLVTSNPSPAYVSRVAAVFNNNGRGVRGDLAAVVRAVLLDDEARGTPPAGFGKLREPVLRVAHWMRSFGATSVSGEFQMAWELGGASQQALFAPSVFGYFRPGYVPPNTSLADAGATAPEFQIVNESTTAAWVNLAETMAGNGLGWYGQARDVSTALTAQIALAKAGNVDGLVQNLNLLLFAGQMSRSLQLDILEALAGVAGTDDVSHQRRARVALYIALSSPEYLVQR